MIGLELTSNFAKTVLASPINASATTITLFPGVGALFPNPSGGNYFRILITDAATSSYNEIVFCTARSGDVLTITRAQEGTSARSWLAGDIIENVMTAGAFSELRSQGLYNNTAIGVLSLNAATTGSNNSAIGTSSLQNITTGSGNSTIGYQSARYIANGSTALTIAANSTYIGTNTKASANSVTNETVIGYNTIGSGSNTITLGGSAVTGTVIPYGSLGIGTSSPAQKLDILSTTTTVAKLTGGTGSNQGSYLNVQGNTIGNYSAIIGGAYNADLMVYGGGSNVWYQSPGAHIWNAGGALERMRINSSGNVGIGLTSPTGKLDVAGTIKTLGYTVATLPTGVTGARAYVTNALAPTFGATVVTGGAVTIPVFYNGTNWIVG
jgi:hypothetical protein